MMTTEQMRAAARQMHENVALTGGPFAGHTAADLVAGPYLVVAAVNGAEWTPARQALFFFPGVPIPYLCQTTHRVRLDQMALHAVPALVFSTLASLSGVWFRMEAALTSDPLPAAPTESDMAAVFVRAMSVHIEGGNESYRERPGGTDLGPAVARACDRMGWRTVVALVTALDERDRQSPEYVVAVLDALMAEPATAG